MDKIKVKRPVIEPLPLRDAYLVVAPKEANPMGVPFIGTMRQCKKALAHLEKKLVEDGYEIID